MFLAVRHARSLPAVIPPHPFRPLHIYRLEPHEVATPCPPELPAELVTHREQPRGLPVAVNLKGVKVIVEPEGDLLALEARDAMNPEGAGLIIPDTAHVVPIQKVAEGAILQGTKKGPPRCATTDQFGIEITWGRRKN